MLQHPPKPFPRTEKLLAETRFCPQQALWMWPSYFEVNFDSVHVQLTSVPKYSLISVSFLSGNL